MYTYWFDADELTIAERDRDAGRMILDENIFPGYIWCGTVLLWTNYVDHNQAADLCLTTEVNIGPKIHGGSDKEEHQDCYCDRDGGCAECDWGLG